MSDNYTTIREITSRSNGGITVTLSGVFQNDNACLYLTVHVESATEDFTISEIPCHMARDVYDHPYVYANRELTSGRLAA